MKVNETSGVLLTYMYIVCNIIYTIHIIMYNRHGKTLSKAKTVLETRYTYYNIIILYLVHIIYIRRVHVYYIP